MKETDKQPDPHDEPLNARRVMENLREEFATHRVPDEVQEALG